MSRERENLPEHGAHQIQQCVAEDLSVKSVIVPAWRGLVRITVLYTVIYGQ